MKHMRYPLLVSLLCASLFMPASARTLAMPTAQAAPGFSVPPGPHAPFQFAPSRADAAAGLDGRALLAIPGWSKLVFQSFRNGNWEIYRANSDGSNQVRVTNDPDIDYAPRLDPGSSRIAFSSNRGDGDYDIYVVNWNGTGLAALTDNGGDDVSPSWSPNGNKLAFESYRDGQGEVYVMTASGSTSVRLTYDNAYDGTPVWSPDGAKIAFTSRRTGSYQIWVMNADGSDQRALTHLPNAYDPAWSPDGSQIAFDADADGDGFEELWVMAADGAGQRQIYNPPQINQVAWARSWSVDGRYIAFSRITFDGSTATEGLILAWDSYDPGLVLPLSPGNRDTNPDWQTSPDPDLWVAQSRSAGLPGEEVELVLLYGNRGAATARNVRVTQTLPAGLTFVRADPPPSATTPALRWTKSSLPASNGQTAIRITVRVDEIAPLGSLLPSNAAIASDTSEPDLDNNSAAAGLYVGRVNYLPWVGR